MLFFEMPTLTESIPFFNKSNYFFLKTIQINTNLYNLFCLYLIYQTKYMVEYLIFIFSQETTIEILIYNRASDQKKNFNIPLIFNYIVFSIFNYF